MPLLHELLVAGNDEDLAELYCAARDGDGDTLSALVLGGCDVNEMVFDESGWREAAIHAAAFNGRTGAVAILCRAGADVNLRAPSGRTAAHWAAQRGQIHALRALLARGADATVKDVNGVSPADEAEVYGHGDARRLLLEAAAVAPAGEERAE